MRRLLVLIAAVGLGGLLAAPAHAGHLGGDTVAWTNESGDGNWANAANWVVLGTDEHKVPGASDDAVIGARFAPILAGAGGVAERVFVLGTTPLQVTDGATLTVVGPGTSSFGGAGLTVRGRGTLTLRGDSSWSTGHWNVGGPGSIPELLGGTVENHGNLSITGNVSSGCPSPCRGVLRNAPGATIESSGALCAPRDPVAGVCPFLGIPFVNDGALTVSAGTLVLGNSTSVAPSSGRFVIAGGAVLSPFGQGSAAALRLSPSGQITGPGTLQLHSGVEFPDGIGAGGAYSVGTSKFSVAPGLGGGFLDLGGGRGSTGRLTSGGSGGGVRDGELRIGDGDSQLGRIVFEDGARVIFDPQGTVEATDSVAVRGGATLTLDGDTTWSAGIWSVGGTGSVPGAAGGTVENRGELAITGNVSGGCPAPCGLVRNRAGAVLRRAGSTGTAALGIPLVNEGQVIVEDGTLGTGSVRQLTGSTAVAGGAALGFAGFSPTLTVDGGELSGTGTITGAVTNAGGTVQPGRPASSPGALTIDGTYTQAAGGTLAVEIEGLAPGTGHDQLAVTGRATLAGRLAITTGAGFDPPLDSTYDIVTGQAVSGRFSPLSATAPPGKGFRDEYAPTLARLRVVRSPIAPPAPEPIVFIPGFLGSRVDCGGRPAWPLPTRPLAMRLRSDGASDLEGPCTVPEGRAGLIESAASDVYGSTVEFLERIAPGRVHVFAYDWRKSPADALAALERLVEGVRGAGKVVLLGHSQGGLVTRWYIDDPARAAKVARAVTLGTAYWGSPKALFPLAAGVESPLPSSLNELIAPPDMQEFARNLTGLYFAWPSAPFGRWLRVGGKRSRPLGGPGVSGFVRDVGGNERLYQRALEGHARALDEFDVNGVDYHVLLGAGKQTIASVRIKPLGADLQGGGNLPGGAVVPKGLYEVGWDDGDETVPRNSAALGGSVPPQSLHIVCRTGHLELAQEQAVLERIGDFLRAGAPIVGAGNDCPARGAEVQAFTLPLGARRTRAADGPPGSMTPEQADRAGAIELLDLGAQEVFATNAATPVTLRLEGRSIGLRVTPLGADGKRGRPRFYGPLSGAITVDAGAGAKIRKGGRPVRPRRRVDRRSPRTRVRVRLHGRSAILRFRATDRSAVAATFATVGNRPTKRVRRRLRLKRADLKRVRFQSVDVFGNLERPRQVRM
jgi:hypothetical protein